MYLRIGLVQGQEQENDYWKIDYKVKNKTWIIPQLKKYKKSHELTLIWPQSRQKIQNTYI